MTPAEQLAQIQDIYARFVRLLDAVTAATSKSFHPEISDLERRLANLTDEISSAGFAAHNAATVERLRASAQSSTDNGISSPYPERRSKHDRRRKGDAA
jgi:hypothetical protein